jgi:aldehyde dehydrogenase
MDQNALVQNVVQEVMRQLGTDGQAAQPTPANTPQAGGNGQAQAAGRDGLFEDVDAAVAAAAEAQQQLAEAGLATREAIGDRIKQLAMDHADVWGRQEHQETGVGRLDHKIEKLKILDRVPGAELLRTEAHSGDEGVSLDELAPWGVIGVITPVTHSVPTLAANAINVIGAGNAMVVNAHPSGAESAATAVRAFNQAIAKEHGIHNLITIIHPPTLKSAEAIFRHDNVPLLLATGGPAVARAAMKQQKRAIVAGPGNPPVVVDETADLDTAARSIIDGGGFDNNLLCIGEKEVFVVDAVFDQMMRAMERAGAVRLNNQQIQSLTDATFSWETDHYALRKEIVGQGTDVLAQKAGAQLRGHTDLLFGETDESNPFVAEEQMVPFVPFVRVPNAQEAIRLAVKHEHGFGHTACIHSNNMQTITQMGRAMNTTLFVVNGPSTAGLGLGGEGYLSYSIATPTGEGVTTPLTFTRFRRATFSQAMRVI